jgi:outer membrane immunogenic protein
MKKFLLASAALIAVGMSAPATAADMGVYKAEPAVAYAYNWTGFYIGGHVGAGWGSSRQSFYQSNAAPFNAVQFAAVNLGQGRNTYGLGGFHGGYNWQATPNILLGVEGDISWAMGGNSSLGVQLFRNDTGAAVFNNFLNMSNNMNWLSSLRGRLGFIAANNVLIYGTGGAAWIRRTTSGNVNNPAGSNTSSIRDTAGQTLSGWVAGGGLEYMFAQNWTVRAEYLYYGGFAGRTTSAACTACNPGAFDGPGVFTWDKLNVQTVSVGLTYLFNAGAVVAKY